ncbi:adenylyl-sulfate kinase [Rugamonas apoptosis]|uniref:Adenylyl-sulfate kinase n=1 Tax=Rugamonas apoptosis TaxID=2758570 RepID=A0A7W2FBB8_9BURK|nr:adenylyl-sulfate kinase [Rugamonas apoptosis]MBA5688449.1 adenylyl-sulfate kinase [Rugamonas apoptosis]
MASSHPVQTKSTRARSGARTAAAQAPATGLPTTVEALQARQSGQDLLRVITCGSAGDGKSTLLGRLLFDARQLYDDQLDTLQAESRLYGTQGQQMDFALLSDSLAAEHALGNTIDVAYRYFTTAKRKFIVADTPGLEQATRNMVSGASTADVAIMLVDVRAGLLSQTRRHAFLASLMGIRHVALAINKMDLADFSHDMYERVKTGFEAFAAPLGFASITTIPISALEGDNLTDRSAHTPWYRGPTLMAYLETVEVSRQQSDKMVYPVQMVNRGDAGFLGYCGTVAQGRIAVGDEIRVTASGQKAIVSDIVTLDGSLPVALAGDAVTLCLDRALDATRGDILSHAQAPLEMTDQFEATIVWLHEDQGMPGRNYELKLAGQWTTAAITNIKHLINVDTMAHEASKKLQLNGIYVCNLKTSKPVAFDAYAASRTLGGLILVDRYTHATVAVGMIRHNLRRAQNVHRQALSIARADREQLNGHQGKVFWFTGLSGSGKSTLANALEVKLHARGMRTYVLDGDNVRQGLNKDLGFTEADRVENIRRIAEVARLMMDAGLVVLTAFISPFKREREMARDVIGADNFVEVYVSTPLDVCEQRDVKGLYKQARAGRIPNMTGINSPYEAPDEPAYEVNASTTPVETIVRELAAMIG